MFRVFCVKGVAGVAVKRDQRRVRVSAMEEAIVLTLAAVKLVTWRTTFCPRRKAVVSVAPTKLPRVAGATAPTGSPLVSTRKGWGAGILTVRRSPVLSPPITELVAAGTLSVTVIRNWVVLLLV